MATTISLTDARSAAIALGGARSVNIQNLEAAAALVTVEGSNDGAIYSAIGVVNIPAEGAQVVNTQGFSLLYLTLPTGETGDVAVNPFDRAASSEVVQEVALNATPPTIDSGAGGIVSVTGSTGSTTLKFPAVPYSGQRITLLNKTTAAYTLSGNGYNINGASTLPVPGRNWTKVFVFDGASWLTVAEDYISGTWTPEIASDIGSIVPVYTSQLGYYTVVGNLVTIWGRISYSSRSGSGSGAVKLAGIPSWLQPEAGQKIVGICGAYNDMFSAVCYIDFGIVSGANFVFLKALNTQATVADLAGVCGVGTLFTITYRIS